MIAHDADSPAPRAIGLTMRLRTLAADLLIGDGERADMLRGAFVALFIRVTSAALLYVTQVVMARWMGASDFGVYVLVWTVVLVLGGLSNAGLSVAMMRLLPHYDERGEGALARGLMFYGRGGALAISTAVAAIAAACLIAYPGVVAAPYAAPLLLAFLCVPLVTLSDLHDGIGRAHRWMIAGLMPPYILRPLLILLAVLAAPALGLPATAETAVLAAIGATWIAALIQFLLIERLRHQRPKPPTRAADLRTWVATAWPLFVIAGCEILLQTADVMIVSAFLSPADVGIYFAAAKTMALVLFVHYAVGSASASRFSAHNATGDRNALARTVRDAVQLTFWPSLLGAATILALGPFLLSLFGPGFEAGLPAMIILAVGFLIRAAMGPSEFLLNMTGHQRTCAAVLAIAAATNIALGIILVPRFGMVGAAIATATGVALVGLLNWRLTHRKLGLSVAIWSNFGARARAAGDA